jgi:SAM-dependent methyltransferase
MTSATEIAENSRARPAPAPGAASGEQRRRSHPRIWDTDWLVLRGMHRVIDRLAASIARPGLEAIDFGCGDKPYERLFTLHGVTYRGADLGGAAELSIGADGRLSAADGSADLVLSFQVLEHVRELDTYLAEARRVLRDDGLLLLSTHGTWLYHPHPEDHRRWTREGLVNDIAVRGFEVISCEPVVGPLAWTTMVRLTCFAYPLRGVPVIGKPLAAFIAVAMNAKAWLEDKVTPGWVTKDNACVYVTLSRKVGKATA